VNRRALEALRRWLDAPQPVERLAFLRIVVPVATLGFLSSRLVHAGDWLSVRAFHVPCLGSDDWRQAVCLPALPVWLAWAIAIATIIAGVALAVGFFTRAAAVLFASLVTYLVLADRLEAFTVTKIAPALTLALAVGASGARYSVDAWRARRTAPASESPTHVSGGVIRFFQVFLVVIYSGAGLAKLRGGWLSQDVLWSHVHDDYQSWIAWMLVKNLPGAAWQALQYLTLVFEVGAPLWFAVRRARLPALFVGLGMHAMIGLMFGPVIWFALLMAGLLIGSYAPAPWLFRIFHLRVAHA
jgi:hypothetical protein